MPTPTLLKDQVLVELALMHDFDVLTTLPFRKYSSANFAHRKSHGKLRLLVDLRRINHFIKHDHIEHSHPVTTIDDAAQRSAENK